MAQTVQTNQATPHSLRLERHTSRSSVLDASRASPERGSTSVAALSRGRIPSFLSNPSSAARVCVKHFARPYFSAPISVLWLAVASR